MKMLGNLGWRGRKEGGDARVKEEEAEKRQLLPQVIHEERRSCRLNPTGPSL